MAPVNRRQPARKTQADTRERILSAAEALFMDRGFASTSLRMITARAKVNVAAVNYHFGSKDALIQEVFERHLAPLNQARIAYLDRLGSRRGRPSVEPGEDHEAMVAPALQVSRDPLRAAPCSATRACILRTFGLQRALPARAIPGCGGALQARAGERAPQVPEPELCGACIS